MPLELAVEGREVVVHAEAEPHPLDRVLSGLKRGRLRPEAHARPGRPCPDLRGHAIEVIKPDQSAIPPAQRPVASRGWQAVRTSWRDVELDDRQRATCP